MLSFQVVVVGSGAGGAAVARTLARAGVDVAVLEEGAPYTARDYGSTSPLEAVRLLYRNAGMTFTVGNQSVLVPVGKCVGGTTVINSGTALRAHPDAVRAWKDEFGLSEFAAHQDRLFHELERDLNVVRVRSEITGENTRVFRRGSETLGWRGGPLTRMERGCRGAGRCYLGCPNDAKQSMNVSFIPEAVASGARLFTGCRARRILVKNGRAVGVQTDGPVFFAHAVVVCAGALFTPRLVGTALKHPMLGRNLQLHPAARVIGEFDRDIRGWNEVPQAYHVDEFLEEGISIEGVFLPPALAGASIERFDRVAMIGYRILERARGRVFGFPRSFPFVFYWLHRDDVRLFQRATTLAAEILFAAGAKKVRTSVHPFEEIESLRGLRSTSVGAADLELSAYHAQGTCRMADSPERGVVDPSGETWQIKNLYVADASIMPATPRHNPQLSIMAFGVHVAENILKRLRKEVANTPH